jgi:prepilin-type N-terminal cleavage/methylation domain-containing protein
MRHEQLPSIQKGWLATNQKGFSLVEVLLSSAVFVLFVTALVGVYLYGQEATAIAGNRARAAMLAEEGLEAVRNIRDAGFSNLVDGSYGLSTISNQWNLSSAPDTSGIFSRQIAISPIDSKRKSVTANITWQQNPERIGSLSLTTQLTNWLIAADGVKWDRAFLSGSLGLFKKKDSIKIQVSDNYAYLIRSNSTDNFMVIDISKPDSPSFVSSISVAGTPTNLFIFDNYAYITSNDNAEELQIIDISEPSSPSIVSSYDAPGNADANGIYVKEKTAYLVRAIQKSKEFEAIDISNPISPTELGTLDLGATGYEIVVSEKYAFIASSSNTRELQVVNISDPTSMSIDGSLNLSGNNDATTIALSGESLFIGQGKNFITVDIAAPTEPLLLGTLEVSGNINDISIDLAGNYIFLADQDSSAEFQVVDITTLATPILSTTVDITAVSPLFGVAYSSIHDRVYGVGASDSQELAVFAPE